MAQGIFSLKQVNQAIRQGAWSAFNPPQWVEYLVVAGGGGAGYVANGESGGGGGGGLLTGMVPVTVGTSYTVTVGGGGAGGAGANNSGVNGDDSVFGPISALGGGGGARYGYDYGSSGGPKDGGSGGGGAQSGVGGPASGTPGQGNAGGQETISSVNCAGGGGGAGTIGLNGVGNFGGNGGAGISSVISGTVTTYAGGGGGASQGAYVGSIGGVGGGGNAHGSDLTSGISGQVNTGGGGGGGGDSVGTVAAGGSGIVIVRYQGTVQFYTGGTVNYANGYIIHTFYATGTLAPTTPTQYSNTYQISRSLRFNYADSAYLNRTFPSAGNRKTWTWSGWVKRTGPTNPANAVLPFFGVTNAGNDAGFFVLGAYGDVISLQLWGTVFRRTTAVYRDYSAWYHIVVAFDTTQGNAANRIKLYINNVEVTAFQLSADPTLNTDYAINNNVAHNIFSEVGVGSYELGGYLAEVNFIDGQYLTPSSFGEYDVNTGVWIPRSYGGSYGTNGFKLNFSDNSNVTAATLGADSSGNGNNFTPNNFSVTAGVTNDSFVDTPTQYGTDTGAGGEVRGNYCTLNPLDVAGTPTISEGNLKIVNTNADCVVRGTFGMPGNSGKWYFEITQQTAIGQQGQSPIVYGMATLQSKVSHTVAVIRKAAYYYTDYIGRYLLIYVNGASAATISVATAIAINEVLQFAYDSDTGKVWIGKGGVWSDSSGGTTGNPATGANATYTFASVDEPMTPTFDLAGVDFTASLNCGQRPFVNTAPTGFKALCTTNLPTPTIGATAATQASKFFNAVTYTGVGGSQAVSVGFQPDFVWMKGRNGTTGHILQNAVTGVTKGLQSNNSDPEFTDNTTLTEFNSAGFKASGNSQTNLSATTYVAWNWKANGAGVNNTDGSITSTVSANPTSGFSVVTYTGVTNGTVGHGLGAVPSMIIVKSRAGSQNWFIYHISNGATKYMTFSTDAATIQSGAWNDTAPTSSVFTTGSFFSTNSMVAYCFAPVAGYSAFGSYIANASTDGPFIHTGFRPAFIMLKRYSAAGAPWTIIDATRNPYNAAALELDANVTSAEYSAGSGMDILSNGFKLRDSSYFNSASADTFIYMAFASTPFKYSLAR